MSTLVHDPDLALALDHLVAAGDLTPELAARVERARDEAAASHAAADATRSGHRTVVALGAVGAGLVAVGLVTWLTATWADLAFTAQLAALVVPGLLALGGGLALALTTEGGVRALRERARLGRCSLVGVLTTLAAALLGIATSWAIAGGRTWLTDAETQRLVLAGFGVALVVAAVGAALAPSALPTLGTWGASLGTTIMGGLVLLGPAHEGYDQWTRDQEAAQLRNDLVVVMAVVVLGMLWCALGPRLARPGELALALGVATWFVPAFAAATEWPRIADLEAERAGGGWCAEDPTACGGPEWSQWIDSTLDRARMLGTTGLVLLALLVVVGLTLFVLRGGWPWAVGGVLAATALTQLLASRTLGAAGAFVLAGLVLVGLSLLLALRRGRRPAVAADAEEPAPPGRVVLPDDPGMTV